MRFYFLDSCKEWFVGRTATKANGHSPTCLDVPVHDVFNVLSLIKGLVEAHRLNIKEGIYGSEAIILRRANETLDKVHSQIDRAIQATDHLRCLANPNKGKCTRRSRVSLYKSAKKAINLLKASDGLEDIEIVNRIPKDLPLIKMHAADLHEIVYNLAANAVDAVSCTDCAEGQVTLSAHILHEPSKKSCLSFQVSDTGPGIPFREVSSLFEPFYTKGKDNGNGLGLFIVRQLVERNGGAISVRSFEGEGATFQVEFPL